MTNDISSPFIASLTFQSTSASYTIGGNRVVVTALSTAGLPGGQTHSITLPLGLAGEATPFSIEGALAISGVIEGPGGFTKTGAGRLTLSGNNTYAGASTVTGGLLWVDGNQPASAVVVDTVQSHAYGLWGSGTVGPVTVVSGFLDPPFGSVGRLSVSGDVSMGSEAAMYLLVGNSTPGSGHAQLAASGAVTLGGALWVSLNPASEKGSVYEIITASGGVTGTFEGLPEGGERESNHHVLAVSYTAGEGTVVTLTDLGVDPALALAAVPAQGCAGDTVTFTATAPSYSNFGIPAPTGMVTFKDGETVLGDVLCLTGRDAHGTGSPAEVPFHHRRVRGG